MNALNFKPLVCALTIGSAAVSNTGCNDDGAAGSLLLEASPASHYSRASGGTAIGESDAAGAAQNAGTEHPTHAETRHFAFYTQYRAMVESSGASGGGGMGNVFSAADDAAEDFVSRGTRLLGVEHLFCPAENRQK